MRHDQTLLIVDDDPFFLRAAQRSLARRDFEVEAASTLHDGLNRIKTNPPAYAVFDLRLEDGSGLDLVDALRRARPDARCVVLTGFGDLSTAVSATKLGAVDYLTKPADADTIAAALRGENRTFVRKARMTRPEIHELRYLLSIFEAEDRNTSRTARLISKHRRSVQRILRRYGVREEAHEPEGTENKRRRIRRMLDFWRGMLEGRLQYDDQEIVLEEKQIVEEPRDRRTRGVSSRASDNDTVAAIHAD